MGTIRRRPRPITTLSHATRLRTPTRRQNNQVFQSLIRMKITSSTQHTSVTTTIITPHVLRVRQRIKRTLIRQLRIFTMNHTRVKRFNHSTRNRIPTNRQGLVTSRHNRVRIMNIQSLGISNHKHNLRITRHHRITSRNRPLRQRMDQTRTKHVTTLHTTTRINIRMGRRTTRHPHINSHLRRRAQDQNIRRRLLFQVMVTQGKGIMKRRISVIRSTIRIMSNTRTRRTTRQRQRPIILQHRCRLKLLKLLRAKTIHLGVILHNVIRHRPIRHHNLATTTTTTIMGHIRFIRKSGMSHKQVLSITTITRISLNQDKEHGRRDRGRGSGYFRGLG